MLIFKGLSQEEGNISIHPVIRQGALMCYSMLDYHSNVMKYKETKTNFMIQVLITINQTLTLINLILVSKTTSQRVE